MDAENKIKSYRDLKIWNLGIEIVKSIYEIAKGYPKDEQYGLVSQMKRSVISIPSNIAEGFKRRSNKEFRQFLYIALGSVAELETQLTISQELKIISSETEENLINKLTVISKMT